MPDENGELEFLDKLKSIYGTKIMFFDVGSHFCTYTKMIIDRFNDYEGHLFELSKQTYKKALLSYGGNNRLKMNNIALNDIVGGSRVSCIS